MNILLYVFYLSVYNACVLYIVQCSDTYSFVVRQRFKEGSINIKKTKINIVINIKNHSRYPLNSFDGRKRCVP